MQLFLSNLLQGEKLPITLTQTFNKDRTSVRPSTPGTTPVFVAIRNGSLDVAAQLPHVYLQLRDTLVFGLCQDWAQLVHGDEILLS